MASQDACGAGNPGKMHYSRRLPKTSPVLNAFSKQLLVFVCSYSFFPDFTKSAVLWFWLKLSRVLLFCDCDVHGISQARILEWVANSFSRGSSQPRDWTHVSYINRWIFLPAPREAPENQCMFIKEKWENLKTLKKQISTWDNHPQISMYFVSSYASHEHMHPT